MHADRRRHLQVPFTRVVLLQGFVGEHAGRTDLHEVAAELVFQHAVRLTTEINLVPQAEHIQSPFRPHTRDKNARNGSTGCSGSSRD